MTRIYLDNAATSWPKPESVYTAMDGWSRTNGANAGRAAYAEAVGADQAITQARRAVADLLGAKSQQVVFTAGCTDGLNLAIHGLLAPGDHVITSAAEHNSVLRPLSAWADRVSLTHLPCNAVGIVDLAELRRQLRPETRLVAVTQASNVTGAIQPIADLCQMLKEHNAQHGGRTKLLVDAAQSLGHLGVRVDQLPIDLLATSGHKGLLGPLGIGVLYLRPGAEAEVRPLRQGGTGSQSDRDVQPDTLPDKYEAGSANMPGIVGLGAGVRHVNDHFDSIVAHAAELSARFLTGVQGIAGVTLYGSPPEALRAPLAAFNIGDQDPREVATILDTHFGVQARAGIHCAPRMHAALGTLARGGAVRLSWGAFNTPTDIDAALEAIRAIAAA